MLMIAQMECKLKGYGREELSQVSLTLDGFQVLQVLQVRLAAIFYSVTSAPSGKPIAS